MASADDVLAVDGGPRVEPVAGRELLRLGVAVMGINLRARMEYRVDFALGVVFGIVYHVAALAFLWVVVAQLHTLGDWTFGQVLFISGLRLVAHGIYETVFGNLAYTTEMIREGRFDRMLIRPVNPFLQLLLSELRVNGLGDLVFGIAVFVFAVGQPALHIDWNPITLGYLALVLVGSCLLEAGIFLIGTTASFWIVQTESLMWWAGDLVNTFGNYPLTIFPSLTRYIFTFAFPIAFLSFFPSAVFLGRAGGVPFTPLFAYGAPLVGIGLFVVAYRIWLIGLRHHQSTGT